MPPEVQTQGRYQGAPLMVRGIETAVGGDRVEAIGPVRDQPTAAAACADSTDGPEGRVDPWRFGDGYIAAEDSSAFGTNSWSVGDHPRSECRSAVSGPAVRGLEWCRRRRFLR